MIDTETRRIIAEAAGRNGIDANALLAVTEVESGGEIYARIGNRLEPLIRFEAHYFDRRLTNGKRRTARHAGLASPIAGAISNPPTQSARWQMLERAMRIDPRAALESVSWGIGQVMGAHWAWLGYASVEVLAAEARSGAAGQVNLMLRYIGKSGLGNALNQRDWAAFARGYNGPDFRRYAYQTRLALACKRFAREENPGPVHLTITPGARAKPEGLRFGMHGNTIAELQQMLCTLGFPVLRDGIFGRRTQYAVRRLQARFGLKTDGIAGPETMALIRAKLMPAFSVQRMIAKIASLLISCWQHLARR